MKKDKAEFVLSIRLTEEQLSLLDRYCEEEDRTRAGSIRRFTRLGLKDWESKHEDS